MNALGRALLESLDDEEVLAEVAHRLGPLLLQYEATEGKSEPDHWMTTRAAADYLGMTVAGLHKLTASRAIPFEQDGPGCRCWFKASELDRWRRGEIKP